MVTHAREVVGVCSCEPSACENRGVDRERDATEGVILRDGLPVDAEVLAALMFEEPGREAVAIAGSAEGARRLQELLLRNGIADGTSLVLVAEIAGSPVGFAETTVDGGMPMSAVARHAVAALGVRRTLASAWKSRARVRVDMSLPEGVHLAELQVSPRIRRSGVGGLLLAEVEQRAGEQGAPRVSLTTAVENPARRLYERNGYRVTAERRDPRYERMSGSAGRVLMVKELSAG